MRGYPADMPTAEVLSLLVLLILVAALFTFARTLHDLTAQMRDAVSKDRVQQVRLEATVDRMERATQVVARNLAATAGSLQDAVCERREQSATIDRMEKATQLVAENLAESVSRADATNGPDGAAADAALRTGDTADAITRRQDKAK